MLRIRREGDPGQATTKRERMKSAGCLLILSAFALIGCRRSSAPPSGSTAGPATPAAQTAVEDTTPVSAAAGAASADPAKFYKKPGYSPYAGRVFPQRPLWGDQHLHTG